ncbi:hypothetical protein TRFO_13488 [Tritrichomonas foetus]|uniref:Kelch motif family protein n=1 Tax=Tritrichomonas foetus TaxID=1144522 RepID=A0A1J4KY36_9EUKA|nr:hypothetical protein TRFO_13488 [Tritrichomonas foetus]|eukprot:OHT16151.1 hypothetical protein TRFO_13488 [Tritrichomonas foetus]
MIDAVIKASLQEIAIPTNATIVSTSDIRPPQCFHEDSFYLCTDDLWYFNAAPPLQWTKVSQVPFNKRQGQSMTSTPFGVVFFGGQEKGFSYHNDLWIFNKGEWSYVTCDIPVRAYHAAACDQLGRLVIYGGTTLNQKVLRDIYIIDMKTQKTIELKFPNLPPVSHDHSLTLLPDGTFCLFGGELELSEDNRATSQTMKYNIYILDFEKLSVKKIATDFENTIGTHFSACIYNMLFIFGGSDRNVWAFNFDHNVWIPLQLPTFNNVKFSPFFAFISKLFTENKCLHLVSDDFKKLASIPIFIEPPPADVKNNPQFIHFLKNHLIYANSYFDKFDPRSQLFILEKRRFLTTRRLDLLSKLINSKIVPEESATRLFKLQDELSQANYIILHAEKVRSLMKLIANRNQINENLISDENDTNTDGDSKGNLNNDQNSDDLKVDEIDGNEKSDDNKENENNDEIQENDEVVNNDNKSSMEKNENDVHKIILELTNMRQRFQDEIEPLVEECDSLAQQIELSTFDYLLQNPDKNLQRASKSITEYETLEENSKQLAKAIFTERKKLEFEKSKISTTHLQKKDTILNIRDQLWGVTKRETEINKTLYETKIKFYKTLSELTKFRDMELSVEDEDARTNGYQMYEIPREEMKIKNLHEKFEIFNQDLQNYVDDLDSSKPSMKDGTPLKKISRVSRTLNNLQKWTYEVKKYFPNEDSEETASKKSKGRKHRRRVSSNIKTPDFFTSFPESIGKNDVYLEDIERVLSKIEEDLGK